MAAPNRLILPDGTKMSEFALLSGAVFTGDLKITKDNPSFILNNTTTDEANLIFHRSNVYKASVALEDTNNNLLLKVLSGKKVIVSWVT